MDYSFLALVFIFFVLVSNGPGFVNAVLHIIGVVLAANGALKLFSKLPVLNEFILIENGMISLILAGLIALWSLFSGVSTATSALILANGNPYCIAQHGIRLDLKRWSQLRGVDFYTLQQTGYKSTTETHYNGILTIQHQDTIRDYYWTGSSFLETPPYKSGSLREDTSGSCRPVANFLSTLDFW